MKSLAKYMKDMIYGANDGAVTTFAVVAGAVGASLSTDVILILGFANLFADGFSMAASDYIGSRSEKEVIETDGGIYGKSISVPSFLTLVSFIAAGTLPLLPYIFFAVDSFTIAIIATGITLFGVGALRRIAIDRNWFVLGVEMLAIGGTASAIAYVIGKVIRHIINV